MKITLKTVAGDFIHSSEIIPLNGYPEVIIWGEKVFAISAPGEYRQVSFSVLLAAIDPPQP